MGARDLDSLIESRYLRDKLLRSREQFARSNVSELEFAQVMDARCRVMLEGREAARNLVDEASRRAALGT